MCMTLPSPSSSSHNPLSAGHCLGPPVGGVGGGEKRHAFVTPGGRLIHPSHRRDYCGHGQGQGDIVALGKVCHEVAQQVHKINGQIDLQEQMVIFDDQPVGTIMGFPQIMQNLGLLAIGKGKSSEFLRLGHGEPLREYHLVPNPGLDALIAASTTVVVEGILTASALRAIVATFAYSTPQLSDSRASAKGKRVAKRKRVAAKSRSTGRESVSVSGQTYNRKRIVGKSASKARASVSVSAAMVKRKSKTPGKGPFLKCVRSARESASASGSRQKLPYLVKYFVRKQVCWYIQDRISAMHFWLLAVQCLVG